MKYQMVTQNPIAKGNRNRNLFLFFRFQRFFFFEAKPVGLTCERNRGMLQPEEDHWTSMVRGRQVMADAEPSPFGK